jgi:hypothetical protein
MKTPSRTPSISEPNERSNGLNHAKAGSIEPLGLFA